MGLFDRIFGGREEEIDIEEFLNALGEEEEVEEAAEAAAPEAAAIPQMPMMQPGMMPQMQLPAFAPSGGAAGGIKLVLKNANIKVEKIILKKKE